MISERRLTHAINLWPLRLQPDNELAAYLQCGYCGETLLNHDVTQELGSVLLSGLRDAILTHVVVDRCQWEVVTYG